MNERLKQIGNLIFYLHYSESQLREVKKISMGEFGGLEPFICTNHTVRVTI